MTRRLGHFRKTMQAMSRGRRKLTDEQVLEIRAAAILGEPTASLAKRYGVAPSTVNDYVTLRRDRGFDR